MAIDEDITLRKLEVFLSFMRHGSMALVAESMGISTVSVHRSLHSLQEGMRCQLFRKEGRSLIPLAAAHTLVGFAEQSVQACEEGIRRTRLAGGYEATRIVIGSGYSLTVKMIPQIIFGLKSKRPLLDVDLKLGSTKELLGKLQKGDLDAAIVVTAGDDLDEDWVSLPLFEDPVYFAAPLHSPYAHQKVVNLTDVKHEKFVSLGEDFLTAEAMQKLFKQAGYTPNVVMRAGNLFSLTNLVAEGIGYGLLPGRVGLFTTQVQLIPLAPPEKPTQTIRLVVLRSREREPNLLALTVECRRLAAATPQPVQPTKVS